MPEKRELSDAVKARMKELKAEAGRKLSMAKLLVENQFPDGAIQPLRDAIQQLTLFQSLEKGLPEPDVTKIDYSTFWDPGIVEFITQPDQETVPLILEAMITIYNPD